MKNIHRRNGSESPYTVGIVPGCVVMKGMRDYGGGNNTIKREATSVSRCCALQNPSQTGMCNSSQEHCGKGENQNKRAHEEATRTCTQYGQTLSFLFVANKHSRHARFGHRLR